MNSEFKSLDITPDTLKAVEKFGYSSMTEIQSKAIPELLKGKDVRGTAKTGSGKTLAFLIPVYELLQKRKFNKSFAK